MRESLFRLRLRLRSIIMDSKQWELEQTLLCTVKAERKGEGANTQRLRRPRISLFGEWTHPLSIILAISVKPKSEYAQETSYSPKLVYIFSS